MYRLHEVTVDARRRARRMLATPFARRKVHDAVTEESDALHMVGFATFDEFAIVYSATPAVDDRHDENAETIARIAEILAEIGIDPSADPLEAAREFLATHEDELLGPDGRRNVGGSRPPTGRHSEPRSKRLRPSHALTTPDQRHPRRRRQPPSTRQIRPQKHGRATDARKRKPIEPMAEAGERHRDGRQAGGGRSCRRARRRDDRTRDVGPPQIRLEGVATRTAPAALHGESGRGDRPERDEEIVDRWISAEARAERMHSEVDRAEAELVALLARSVELESTVVERVSERDHAHADLEDARARVAELEQSIARSDSERAEIEAALATSRDRIAELEVIAVDREHTYAESERDHAGRSGPRISGRTSAHASRSGRPAAVAALEAEFATHTADLDLRSEEARTGARHSGKRPDASGCVPSSRPRADP